MQTPIGKMKFLETPFPNQHNVSMQGSLFKAIPARFSFGTTKQEGAVLTSQFERRNLSLALNPSFFR